MTPALEPKEQTAMPRVKVRWVQGRQFVGTDSTGHSVILSGDEHNGGVKPSEMLLVALAACSGVDVVDILAKKRRPVQHLEVIVNGERDAEPPWAYRRITVRYRLRGRRLSEKAVAQAVSLSQDKYCSVTATVREVARIETEFEILPADDS
jgi:putative redox protein